MSKIADKFWDAVGDMQQMDIEDALILKEEMIQAITTIEMMEGAVYEAEMMDNETEVESSNKLKRGDEIKEFYYVGETRGGCPKIERRAIGIKGITLIEVSNVGNSYENDKHLSKVRATGVKEDGKTQYKLFFTNVFTEVTDALITQYNNACKKHRTLMGQFANQVATGLTAHATLMEDTYKWLLKKRDRNSK